MIPTFDLFNYQEKYARNYKKDEERQERKWIIFFESLIERKQSWKKKREEDILLSPSVYSWLLASVTTDKNSSVYEE